jgi:putative membrane protein insertion efficiency factor
MRGIVIAAINVYQMTWPIREPFVRMFGNPDAYECRFTPTCSQYTIDAVQKHGVAKGLVLGFRRLGRCRPNHPGGHDPVP